MVDADYKITRDAQAKDRGAKPDASGWARCESSDRKWMAQSCDGSTETLEQVDVILAAL